MPLYILRIATHTCSHLAILPFYFFTTKFVYLCIREKIGLLISRFTGDRKVRTP